MDTRVCFLKSPTFQPLVCVVPLVSVHTFKSVPSIKLMCCYFALLLTKGLNQCETGLAKLLKNE